MNQRSKEIACAAANQGDFSLVLASSVHDMKNSLGMLLTTLAEMMESYPPQDQKQAEFFATLEYEAARINSELVQLLTLYRMDEQTLVFEVDEHSVLDLIEDQIARNDTLLRVRNLVIDVDCAPELHWYFDNEMMAGVINNILVNCARYSRQRLLVSAWVEDEFLCISIADDGDGYPEFMLQGAVPPSKISYRTGSTKLGLLFAQRVMQLHKSRDRQGYLSLANQGPLGGGVLNLYLP